MFLDFFNFNKKNITSNASRNIYNLKNIYNFKNSYNLKNLFFFKKWSSGRVRKGWISNYSKKSLLIKYKRLNINYNYNFNKLGIISNFYYINNNKKIVILINFFNGSFNYINSTQFIKIFNYYLFFNKNFNFFKFKFFFFKLYYFKKLTNVSLIELLPNKGSQYVKSSGTKAKILQFNNNNHTLIIQLPSSIKKIFSQYSIAFLGRINFKLSKKLINTKSGYWRNFGIKSIVRGVAKNPIDHPHGGRTKSIRLAKTPWGKITKK